MIETLREYFKQRNDVAFAFLYGSYARGNASKLSDIDIAVYFYPVRNPIKDISKKQKSKPDTTINKISNGVYPQKRHPIEYEEEVFYKGEDEIWGDLQKILKKEVEVLVLNRVPASVAASAIRGFPIVINDWGLYLDFMEIIIDEGDDYRNFVLNYYKERKALAKRVQS